MKKNLVRIVAFLLVAMLALTLLPMGAFAYEDRDGVYVGKEYYTTTNPSMYDYSATYTLFGELEYYAPGSTIKVSDYDILLDIGGELFDFAGFDNMEAIFEFDPKVDSEEEYLEWAKETDLPFINKDISVPKDQNTEENKKWYEIWNWIYAAYVPHQHSLSCWYSDGTTHWRECLVCDENFMYQNWCQDGDEDGICNVCGGDVPYHDVIIKDSEGGKITANEETAAHRTKITVDVEPAEGYRLKKLHFVKVREDGSRQEITRRKLSGQYWTYMPTYDLEISAEFVKK